MGERSPDDMKNRLSRNNRTTIANTDMKRLNRRYASVKKKLNLKKIDRTPASQDDSIEQMNLYHKAVLTKIIDKDFYKKLDQNAMARDFFLENHAVKHTVKRIRDNPSLFKTFQHNQDIVKFINLSTCENSSVNELPTGWKSDQDKKKRNFYVNTQKKFTSYYHPKILEIQKEDTITETEEVLEPEESHSIAESVQDSILTYPDQVIIFLSKNTNEMLIRKLPQIKNSTSLQRILNKVRDEGVQSYERYVSIGAFAQFLSFFDEEISAINFDSLDNSAQQRHRDSIPHSADRSSTPTRAIKPKKKDNESKSPIEIKIGELYTRLEHEGYGQGPTKLKMNLKRETFLQDAFDILIKKSRKELQRSKLFITFKGEEGLDYSGPSREFFHLASCELFNPYYCWFEYTQSDRYKVQISDHSLYNCQPHKESTMTMTKICQRWFQFMGRLLGLALIHRYLIDAQEKVLKDGIPH